jgi:hypothetical protein
MVLGSGGRDCFRHSRRRGRILQVVFLYLQSGKQEHISYKTAELDFFIVMDGL